MLMTTGDAGDTDNSQDLESLNGKILRLNMDGSIPADNPYPDGYVYPGATATPKAFASAPTASSTPLSMDRTKTMSSIWWKPDGTTDGPMSKACVTRLRGQLLRRMECDGAAGTWTPCIAVNGGYYTEAIPEFQGESDGGARRISAQYERLSVLELSEDGLSVLGEELSSFNQRIKDIAVNYTGAFYLAFNGTQYPGSPPNIIKEFNAGSQCAGPVIQPILHRPIPAQGAVDVSVTKVQWADRSSCAT